MEKRRNDRDARFDRSLPTDATHRNAPYIHHHHFFVLPLSNLTVIGQHMEQIGEAANEEVENGVDNLFAYACTHDANQINGRHNASQIR